jgi:hypothetical protein
MKKIAIFILFYSICQILYSQVPVEYLYVNISIQDVNYAGYIVNSNSKISEVLWRKCMNNNSLFFEEFITKMEADSINLITPELTNYLRFTNAVSEVFTVYDFRKISKKDIKEALLLDVIRFWPGKILLSDAEPDNPPWTNENSEMINLGNYNGKEYTLYNQSGNSISKKIINDLKILVQKSKPDERLLEEKLRKFQLVLVASLLK